MIEYDNQMHEIEGKIEVLKMKKNKMKKNNDKSLRLRSNNCGKSNMNQRVSLNFRKFADSINKRREENGFNSLSYPKISELQVTHKKYSPLIKKDIINYNTILDDEDEETEFNDR